MTAQEIFNGVYRHLLKQKCRSMIGGMCFYRGPFGRKCAIGGILPNKLYKTEMEGSAYKDLIFMFPEVNDYFGQENRELLATLQRVHDSYDPTYWVTELKKIAERFNLDVPKDI